MNKIEKILNGFLVACVATILTFSLVRYFITHENVLWLLDGIALFAIATGSFLNIRFGISKAHYGYSLLAAVFGVVSSLIKILFFDQKTLHKGLFVWNIHVLDGWMVVFFTAVIVLLALFLIIFDRSLEIVTTRKLNSASGAILLLLAAICVSHLFLALPERQKEKLADRQLPMIVPVVQKKPGISSSWSIFIPNSSPSPHSHQMPVFHLPYPPYKYVQPQLLQNN